MASDYASLVEENIRRYGSETAHLAILGALYSERTHFIFELLQNSEDAKATKLQFHLRLEGLELRHNGRPFNPDDVCAVCRVCESTNQGDPERIGRFGIGFKSVYAYTSTPEIHSGDEHFAIRHYVRPQAANARKTDNGVTTLIVLPFDTLQITPQTAYSEISRAFSRLDLTSLLFLRHIQRVEMLVAGATPVVFGRNLMAQLAPWVRIVSLTSTEVHAVEQRWLVFDRPCNLTTAAGKQVPARVELAFALTPDGSERKLTIVNRKRATIAVFFPTDKPTATGFIFQGPYRTTPARDNILVDDANNVRLVNETVELVAATLSWLRDQGALTVEVLNTLPLRRAEFPEGSFLRPVFDRVLAIIKEEPLLPAFLQTGDTTSFAAGNQAKVASSSELRGLLSTEQLRQLVGVESEWRWLADGISVRGDSDLAGYLRTEVGVREVTASDLVSWLESKDVTWWKSMEDSWLIRAYHYLHGQTAEHNRLRKLPIIRLESGEHASPSAQAIFFPADNGYEKDELAPFLPQLPIIRQSFLERDGDKALENFLRQMGVSRLAAAAFIRRVLIPRYSSPKGITAEENRAHVRFVFQAFERMPAQERQELASELGKLNWLLCRKLSKPDSLYFVNPTEAHLGQTYTGNQYLEVFFSVSPEIWFLDSSYPREGEKWVGFFESLGCSQHPRRTEEGHELEELRAVLTKLPTLNDQERLVIADAILGILSAMVPEQNHSREAWMSVKSREWIARRGPGGGDWCFRQGEARFFGELKRRAWMPDGNRQLCRPDALFEDNEQNRRLLGDEVAYLHKDIVLDSEKRQWLATELGVHRRPTKEAVLGRLKGIKTREATLQQVVFLYEFLAQIGAVVTEDFEEGGLILCPDCKTRWLAPSQSFWEDESPVFNSTRGYLKRHYPNLHDFFAKTGVPQRAGPTDYVEALLEAAKIGTTDEATRNRIHRIYRRLAPRLEEGGDWQAEATWRTYWSHLQDGRYWLGQKGKSFDFFRRDELVRVDNEHIGELFRENLPFWPFADLNNFASGQLSIVPVSSALCRFAVGGEEELVTGLSDGLRERWELIAAFLHSEKWNSEVRRDTKVDVSNPPTVRLTRHITVTYELKGVTVEEEGGKDSFFNNQNAVIWLTAKPDTDDLIEAMGDALQEFFGPEVLREFVCDLFRKGPDKTLQKWRKKGLILRRSPNAEQDAEVDIVNASDGETEETQSIGLTTLLPPIAANTITGTARTDVAATQDNRIPSGQDSAENPQRMEQRPYGEMTPTTKGEPAGASALDSRDAAPPFPVPNNPAIVNSHVNQAETSPTETEEPQRAIEHAFNRPGRTDFATEQPSPGRIRDARVYRQNTRQKYLQKRQAEPPATERKRSRTVEVWDPKNKEVRDFFFNEYSGRCQICRQTFPRREDGKPYFEAVYLVLHSAAAWTDEPGGVLCLCAQCSAKFQHGTVECNDVIRRLLSLRTESEAGTPPVLKLRLVGQEASIRFSDRHLVEIQELIETVGQEPKVQDVNQSDSSSPSHPTSLPPSSKELVQCPKCPSKVRADKLQSHLKNVHTGRSLVQATNPSRPKPTRGDSSITRCRSCGRPAIPGADYCYSCG